MSEVAQPELLSALKIARIAPVQQAANGIRYASHGDTQLSFADLERMVMAVPQTIAAALHRKSYYFVPLVVGDAGDTESRLNSEREIWIAPDVTAEWSEQAVCHRNATCDGVECVFISTRLMQDRFALAFEFFINTGHHFVDAAGVPDSFAELVWSQATANVRGETSQDAWEQRAKALGRAPEVWPESSGSYLPSTARNGSRRISSQTLRTVASPVEVQSVDEKARMEYLEAAFADVIAIYMLSLTIDFDYTELREREYPLLAAPALAERLQHIAKLFPANAGQEFSVRYRRRNR